MEMINGTYIYSQSSSPHNFIINHGIAALFDRHLPVLKSQGIFCAAQLKNKTR